ELLVRKGVDASNIIMVNKSADPTTRTDRGKVPQEGLQPTPPPSATARTPSGQKLGSALGATPSARATRSGRQAAPSSGPNPYTSRTAIDRPEGFFNRERECRSVRSFLSNRQNCQIIGPRRIGKSSLLLQVRRELPAWGEGETAAAYLDLQDEQCDTVKGW